MPEMSVERRWEGGRREKRGREGKVEREMGRDRRKKAVGQSLC